MKFKLVYLICFIIFFSQTVKAEIVTSHIKFDTKINHKECVKRSKLAKLELFKDDFGESVLDYSYSYLNDHLSITVACMEDKELVMIFVATQGKNPVYYLRVFEEYIKGKPQPLQNQ